ncbi:hypothetical protein ABE10_12620 [Bacillus toyonensis]|nr:hypothetical protein [Bacillus toyonensis]
MTRAHTQRIFAGSLLLATCLTAVGAGSAFAWDGQENGAKTVPQNVQTTLVKTASDTGESLDGAVFEVTATPWVSRAYVGIGWNEPGSTDPIVYRTYVDFDPSTWGLRSLDPFTPETYDPTEAEWIAEWVARVNATADERDAERAELLAPVANFDPEAAAAAIAAWDAFRAENDIDALRADNDEKQSIYRDLSEQVQAYLDRDEQPPAELAVEHATARDAAFAAAEAVEAAMGEEGADLEAAATSATQAQTQYDALLAEADERFPVIDRISADEVDPTPFRDAAAILYPALNEQIENALAQAECNESYGLPTTPVRVEDGAPVYHLATCDGVAYLPIQMVPTSVQEITAPEGFVLDETVYSLTPVREGAYSWKDGEVAINFGGGASSLTLPFANEREEEPPTPPTDPPTPPVTPPTEPPAPPVTPPSTPDLPETLAMTGSDSVPITWGVVGAAALLAAGAGAIAFGRRKETTE